MPKARLWNVVALLCLVLALSLTFCRQRRTVEPGYHEYAYVTNGKSNSVSVIDLLQLQNVKTIAVGASPTGVAANPLNIALDFQTASDLKAVWPELKTFLGTLGVKF